MDHNHLKGIVLLARQHYATHYQVGCQKDIMKSRKHSMIRKCHMLEEDMDTAYEPKRLELVEFLLHRKCCAVRST